MINKCLNKRRERKWEAGTHNFSLRRAWILARRKLQCKIIFFYSWAKVWWNGGFSDNTALNRCLSWPLISTPEQQHTMPLLHWHKYLWSQAVNTLRHLMKFKNKSSVGVFRSCWEDADTVRLGMGMGPVTPGCLVCLWMFPGFASESIPPSPHPPDRGGRLGLRGCD